MWQTGGVGGIESYQKYVSQSGGNTIPMKLKYQSFSLTKLSCLFDIVDADLLHFQSVRKLSQDNFMAFSASREMFSSLQIILYSA
jgi:hypothetical protein